MLRVPAEHDVDFRRAMEALSKAKHGLSSPVRARSVIPELPGTGAGKEGEKRCE